MATGVKVSGLRTKARVFEPEAFDPGQVVEFGGKRGVVWSLGCDVGRSTDSRWVVVEDGSVELLVLHKDGKGKDQTMRGAGWTSWMRYVPANPAPFTVAEFASEFVQSEMELAA